MCGLVPRGVPDKMFLKKFCCAGGIEFPPSLIYLFCICGRICRLRRGGRLWRARELGPSAVQARVLQ